MHIAYRTGSPYAGFVQPALRAHTHTAYEHTKPAYNRNLHTSIMLADSYANMQAAAGITRTHTIAF